MEQKGTQASKKEQELQHLVGRVAGAVCEALATDRPIHGRCMFVMPAITYKVHRVLSAHALTKKNVRLLKKTTKEVRSAMEQVMRFYDYEKSTIRNLGATIEKAVLRSLRDNVQ